MVSVTTAPFSYITSGAPKGYQCGSCGASGVKLWRLYNIFLDHQKLFCAACALKEEEEAGPVGADGRHESKYGRTDQIGSLIPAVPTEDGETYWGYTSVPMAGVDWWRALPTTKEAA